MSKTYKICNECKKVEYLMKLEAFQTEDEAGGYGCITEGCINESKPHVECFDSCSKSINFFELERIQDYLIVRNGPQDFVSPSDSPLPSDYHIEIIGQDVSSEPVKCMVDVYAIQNYLDQSPQVAHAFKKLWMPGGRNGGKDYKQDIEEARNQLNMELKRLDDLETLNED